MAELIKQVEVQQYDGTGFGGALPMSSGVYHSSRRTLTLSITKIKSPIMGSDVPWIEYFIV